MRPGPAGRRAAFGGVALHRVPQPGDRRAAQGRRLRRLGDGEADARAASDPAPATAAERADDYAATLRALGRLSQNQQEVLRLKFQHGLSYKQIAEVTRLTVTNVGFLIHAGLKKLRRQMREEVME